MQNGLLYQTMFPGSDTITEAQKAEITRWYIGMLEDDLRHGQESFLKGCSLGSGPVGFCGWTVIERKREAPVVGVNDGQEDGPPKPKQNNELWLPEAIDVDGWIAVSRALRTERDRALKDLDGVCRKLMIALPAHSKQPTHEF